MNKTKMSVGARAHFFAQTQIRAVLQSVDWVSYKVQAWD
jgi:hypothetical protein